MFCFAELLLIGLLGHSAVAQYTMARALCKFDTVLQWCLHACAFTELWGAQIFSAKNAPNIPGREQHQTTATSINPSQQSISANFLVSIRSNSRKTCRERFTRRMLTETDFLCQQNFA
jgi:hypothetical protein